MIEPLSQSSHTEAHFIKRIELSLISLKYLTYYPQHKMLGLSQTCVHYIFQCSSSFPLPWKILLRWIATLMCQIVIQIRKHCMHIHLYGPPSTKIPQFPSTYLRCKTYYQDHQPNIIQINWDWTRPASHLSSHPGRIEIIPPTRTPVHILLAIRSSGDHFPRNS